MNRDSVEPSDWYAYLTLRAAAGYSGEGARSLPRHHMATQTDQQIFTPCLINACPSDWRRKLDSLERTYTDTGIKTTTLAVIRRRYPLHQRAATRRAKKTFSLCIYRLDMYSEKDTAHILHLMSRHGRVGGANWLAQWGIAALSLGLTHQ